MSSCPTPETLGRLAFDSANGSRFANVEAHVQGCANCQEVLERLVPCGFGSEGRGPGRRAEPEASPTIPGFVIERELGRGGMGVVYQAWQAQLARHVAIKVVRASVGIGAEDRRRWLREARAIGRVRHRNVVQLHEAGEQDGCLYLVLELISGGSLADRVTGPLPARVAVGLMAAVARAVEQIHGAGMLHLDIKPSNILLDGPPDGPWDQVVPMLADFGIARAGDEPAATASGSIGVGGTPSFMAPEQIVGDRAGIGPRSDVFALGATLYSLLTGRPPFQAASVIETLDLVRTREPAPPRTLVPGLPRDLETITLTCLRKDPQRRYASAGALADDLRRWLDGFPIRARPVSRIEHAGHWCRRRPALATLLAVLAVTMASSLLAFFVLWRRADAERARAEDALARAIESDRATSAATRVLVDLLATNVDAPQMLASERIDWSSRIVRDLTAKLRQDRNLAATSLVAICELERGLASALRPRRMYADSRALLMDSLELLEERRRDADDPDVDEAYAGTLMELGWGDLDQGHVDAALDWFGRADEVLRGVVRDPRRLKAIVLIDRARLTIAELLGRRGRGAQRRERLEEHIRMLDRLGESGAADPAIGLLAAFTRAELAPVDGGFASIRAAIGRFPTDRRLPFPFDARVGDWITADINPYPTGPDPAREPTGRLDPDPHADRVIRALESRCEALGVDRSLLPVVAMKVGDLAGRRGAEHRRAGRLDEARRTAACLSAFARKLARRDPDEPVFHLLLSEAFQQEAKNAWKVEDHATIRASLAKALGEARIALSLDPQSIEARTKVASLQDKLSVSLPGHPLQEPIEISPDHD